MPRTAAWKVESIFASLSDDQRRRRDRPAARCSKARQPDYSSGPSAARLCRSRQAL